MKTPPCWHTAVHESGHFVFTMLAGLGPVCRLTINQEVLTESADWIALGQCGRKATWMDGVMRCKIDGRPMESAFRAGFDSAAPLAYYARHEADFVQRILITALAGGAAEVELAGVKGVDFYSDADVRHATEAGLLLVPRAELRALMKRRVIEIRQLCAGPLRHTILAAAERLLSKRELNEQEAAALWEEVMPAPTTIIDPRFLGYGDESRPANQFPKGWGRPDTPLKRLRKLLWPM